jgi:hypothetical protein
MDVKQDVHMRVSAEVRHMTKNMAMASTSTCNTDQRYDTVLAEVKGLPEFKVQSERNQKTISNIELLMTMKKENLEDIFHKIHSKVHVLNKL